MTGVWVLAGSGVLAVVAAVLFVRDEAVRRRDQRAGQHEAWLLGVFESDREVAELEAMARRVVREHEGRP